MDGITGVSIKDRADAVLPNNIFLNKMSRKFYIATIVVTIGIATIIVSAFVYFQGKNKIAIPSEIPPKNEKITNLLPIEEMVKKTKLEINTGKETISVNNIYKKSDKILSNNGVAFEDNEDYYIAYYPDDNSFTIVIHNRDVNLGREKAEIGFLNDLGITQEQACKLTVILGVPYSVSENLSGQNFGLSFCPGGKPFEY